MPEDRQVELEIPSQEVHNQSSNNNEDMRKKENEAGSISLDQQSTPSSSGSNTKDSKDLSSDNIKSDREEGSIFGNVFFFYLFKYFRLARVLEKKGQALDETTLPTISTKDRPETLEEKIQKDLDEQRMKHPNKKPNLSLAVLKVVKWKLIIGGIVELAYMLLRVFSGYVSYKIINVLIFPIIPFHDAYIWSAILSVTIVLANLFEHQAFEHKSVLPLYVRGAIISLVYSKVNKLSVYSMNKISLGKIINIVANEVNIFEKTGMFFSSVVTGVILLIAGTALLWYWFNATVLVGIGYMILTFPMLKLITDLSAKPRAEMTKVTDKRIKLMNEILDGIRLLKMYTWEVVFKDYVKEIRKKEVSLLKKIAIFDSIARTIAFSSQIIAVFLILMLYNLTSGELSPAKVFPTLFVVGFIRIFCVYFIAMAILFITEVRMLFDRIMEILESPEMENVAFCEPEDQSNSIEFKDFSAYWTKSDEKSDSVALDINEPKKNKKQASISSSKPAISNVSLKIKHKSLTAIVGKVGSGKSSFLLCFTGEMPKTEGSLRYKGSIAYVEQEPTIFAGNIRESICFGKPYRKEFYDKVVKACNLESDFKLFSNGDMSEVGEKGVNMSGGQKARLSLARAVYADADIYLLDDPLSAVDAKVAKSLYEDAIQGLLKDKTVILATHQVHFVKDLENIMIIDEGKIVAHGNYKELKNQVKNVDTIFSHHIESEEDYIRNIDTDMVEKAMEKEKREQEVIKAKEDESSTGSGDYELSEDEVKIFNPEDSDSGKITWRTYWQFIKDMGLISITISTALFTINQMAQVAFGRILAQWSARRYTKEKSLAIEGGLTGFVIVVMLLSFISWYLFSIKAAEKHHDKMLDRVIRNPIQFFDTNPLGRVLNRFSNDTGTIDAFLPIASLDSIDLFSFIFAMVLTTAIVQPITLGPVVLAIIAIIAVVSYFYPAIKQSRNYELLSRSPLYTQFSSTLSGIIIIRSYKQRDTITSKFRSYLNNNVRGSIAYSTTSRALGFYVDLFYTVASIGNIFILISGAGNGGIEAFILILILSVSGVVQYTLRQMVQTHLLMASVARVQSYCNTPSEASLEFSEDRQLKKEGWPKEGNINFNHVYMKYRPDTPLVVKDLDLSVKPGEKIGCVGRTGAGKSSIIQILFRMVEIEKGEEYRGSSVEYDNVDTMKLGLHTLRNSISIIPQTPFMFQGTVRRNLDPLKQCSDQELWKVLEDVNLREHVQDLDDGLDTDMTNVSSVFSVGQKQLVCLARAILKKSKVLVLDEATANVDKQTDEFIQLKIKEKFSDCTVFTIAHRLSTIADYDKVLVMDKGRKVEFDEPYKLLVNSIGDDSITNNTGEFASMVLNTGKKTSASILKTAKAKFDQKDNYNINQ